jgi:hypothetical protein
MSTQAIQIYSKIQDPFAAAIQIGSHFARSGMFGVDRAEAGTILALACITENQTPFEILRTYDIVLGKLRKKALACYAEFRARGGRVKWINTGDEGKEAVAEFTFEGQTLSVRFSIDDAKKQGLVKNDSAWVKTPGNMLRARVLSNAIGMLCPEIVAGMIDDADDSPASEPKPILQEKPETASKATTTIVDVEVVKPVDPTPPAPPSTPVATPTPTPAPKEIFQAKADAKTGMLTNETVEALSAAFGGPEGESALIAWLNQKGWIQNSKIHSLSVTRAQRLLDKPDVALSYIKSEVKGGK